MRSASRWTAVAGMLILSTVPAAAQTGSRFTIQGSGIYVGVGGSAFEGLENGPGFEAQIRLRPQSPTLGLWSFGAGFQYSSHGIEDESGVNADVALYGGFFEPRRVIPVQSDKFAPYVSARLAVLRESLDYLGATASATGVQINGGGGFLINLAPNVNLDIGATLGYIRFGDLSIEVGGQRATIDGGSGNNLVMRAGVAVGLGR
jgi:hypothetical protein